MQFDSNCDKCRLNYKKSLNVMYDVGVELYYVAETCDARCSKGVIMLSGGYSDFEKADHQRKQSL